jgi:hypothetical protein
MLDGAKRLDSTGGQASPSNRQGAEAAFILTEDPYRTSMGGWNDLLEPCFTGSLGGCNGLRMFLCGWGAAP